MTSETNSLAAVECSLEQLAALAGVSGRHVRRLLGEIPQTRRGRWALGPAVAAILEGLSAGPAGDSLTRERTRLVKAQADKAELEFAAARKAVAPLAEIQRVQERSCILIRNRMLQIPQRAVTQIVAERDEAKIKAVLTAEIKLALTTAANEIPGELEENHDDDEIDE